MSISSLIAELRKRTNAPLMSCKKALEETGHKIEEALDWLRKKSIVTAVKKSANLTEEGIVGVYSKDDLNFMLQLNCQTDFMSRGDGKLILKQIIGFIAERIDDVESIEDIKELSILKLWSGKEEGINKSIRETLSGEANVSDFLQSAVGICGENLQIEDFHKVESDFVVKYIHNSVASYGEVEIGGIGVLIGMKNADKSDLDIVKNIAMHIAFSKPVCIDINGIPSKLIEKERKIKIQEGQEKGLPDKMLMEIVDNQIQKYAASVALLSQPYIKDNSVKVGKMIENYNKDNNKNISIEKFVVLSVKNQ